MLNFRFLLVIYFIYAAAAKLLQSCPILCDPIDGSPPGFPIPGILQARTLEWVAISFSNAWQWKVKVKLLSCIRLLATPWTAAHQAPPSMGFSRQEYWSGVPLPSPIYLVNCFKLPSHHYLYQRLSHTFGNARNNNLVKESCKIGRIQVIQLVILIRSEISILAKNFP